MSNFRFWTFFIIAIAVILCFESGCVRRRMFIRAFPEGNSQVPINGAMVYINKEPVGRTPLTCHFTHYGTMEFSVVKEGYETVTEYRKIRAPWYEFPVIDFFSEVVVPQEITDTKQIDFQMKPSRPITQDELVERAEGMRREAQANATFRTNNGTTSGTINPITTPPASNNPFNYGDSNINATPYDTGIYSNDASTNVGSIGVPSSPFINTPVPASSPSYQQNNNLVPSTSNPYNY